MRRGRSQSPCGYNGERYRGINVLMLWAWSLEKGFVAPIWMTFKQAAALGAHVRKGEHGSLVVFASRMKKTDQDDNGEEIEREIPFLKGYTVFNVEQIEGLPAHYYARVEPVHSSPLERVEAAEKFFASDRRGNPARRQSRFLQDHGKLCANAGVADLPRR